VCVRRMPDLSGDDMCDGGGGGRRQVNNAFLDQECTVVG
jgi:hypothetical protein